MFIKDFWESNQLIAIHCDTQVKAKRLLKVFVKMGKRWQCQDLPYTQSAWSVWKNEMCYDNKGGFGRIINYKMALAKIVEFDELDDFKPIVDYKGGQPSSLTTRQWKTYNLIKANTKEGKWTSKKEIVNNYPYDKESNAYGYIAHDRNHDYCAGIWDDIDIINKCPEIDKIIITDGKNNCKLAETKDEATDYLEKFKDKAIRVLMRYSVLKNKIKKDGQGKLLSNRAEPIDIESKAREYVETFLK